MTAKREFWLAQKYDPVNPSLQYFPVFFGMSLPRFFLSFSLAASMSLIDFFCKNIAWAIFELIWDWHFSCIGTYLNCFFQFEKPALMKALAWFFRWSSPQELHQRRADMDCNTKHCLVSKSAINAYSHPCDETNPQNSISLFYQSSSSFSTVPVLKVGKIVYRVKLVFSVRNTFPNNGDHSKCFIYIYTFQWWSAFNSFHNYFVHH